MVKVKLPKKIKTSLGHIQRRSSRYSAPKIVKKDSGVGFREQNDGSAMNSDANGTCVLPCNLGNYSTPLLDPGDSQVLICPETLPEGSEFPLESVDVNSTSSSTSRLSYHSVDDSNFIPSKVDSQVTNCSGTPSSILCTSRNSSVLSVNFPHDSHEILSRVNSSINTIQGTPSTINDSTRDPQVSSEVSTMNSESSGDSLLPCNIHNYSNFIPSIVDENRTHCSGTPSTSGSTFCTSRVSSFLPAKFPNDSHAIFSRVSSDINTIPGTPSTQMNDSEQVSQDRSEGSSVNSESRGNSALPCNLGNYSSVVLNPGDSQVVVCPETVSQGSEIEGSMSEIPLGAGVNSTSSSTSRLSYHSIQNSHFIPSEGNSQVTHCSGTSSSNSGSLSNSLNSDLQTTRNTKKVSRKNMRNTKVSLVVKKTRKQKGEVDNTCKTCNKKLAFNQNLKLHEKIHSGNKNHRCNLCGYATFQKNHLEDHIRLRHTKERPFKCQVENCRLAFHASGTLKRHQLTHRKDDESLKKFTCSLCSYKTVRKGDVTVHQKAVHSNVRDFKCPFLPCEYAAAQRGNLNFHIKRKHKNQSPPSFPSSSAVSLESLEVIQEEDEEAEPLRDIVVENQHDEISAGENLIQGEEVETTLTVQNDLSNFFIIGHSLDSRGKVVYVVQENCENSSSFEYLSSTDVRGKFPALVIKFFESNPHYWKCPKRCQNGFHKSPQ